MTKTLASAGQSKYASGYTLGSSGNLTNHGVTLVNKGTLAAAATAWGVEIYGTGNTLINYGVIVTPPGYYSYAGVNLVSANNVVYNKQFGTLGSGGKEGFYSTNNSVAHAQNSTLINAGLIEGATQRFSVDMEDSGIVTNLSTGTISQGIIFFNGYTSGGGTATSNVSVVNSGKILGTAGTSSNYGAIYARNGGTVTNLAGTISGNTGVFGIKFGNYNNLNAAGTITNAATIQGGTGDAILMAAIAGNRIIDKTGGVFIGTVDGGSNATMELASTASAGVLSAPNGQFTHFSSLIIDSGARWSIVGSTGLSSEFPTIGGFTVGDTVSLSGLAQTPTTFASSVATISGTVETAVTIKASSTALETLTLLGSIASNQIAFTPGITSTLTVNAPPPTVTSGGTVTFNGGGAAVAAELRIDGG